jgi:hypothetical protein
MTGLAGAGTLQKFLSTISLGFQQWLICAAACALAGVGRS